ncbi:linoleate diol synthase [Apiospora arundinis]
MSQRGSISHTRSFLRMSPLDCVSVSTMLPTSFSQPISYNGNRSRYPNIVHSLAQYQIRVWQICFNMHQNLSWTETLRWEICCILLMLLYFLLLLSKYSVVEISLCLAVDKRTNSQSLSLKQLLNTRRRRPKHPTSHPNLRTGTPYPDPALVFNTLLGRGVAIRDNPSQISSLLLHFAALISIDASVPCGVLEINHNRLRTLRLSPLYGKISTEEARVRKYSDGLLKDDKFASVEAMLLPPGVRILLVMFNRFHNYVATGLLAINESNRFSKSLTELEKDEALYQMARHITCRLYVNIILNDYLRTLLGINKSNTAWDLQPRNPDWGLSLILSKLIKPAPDKAYEVANSLILSDWWKNALSEEDNDYMSTKETNVTSRGQASDSDMASVSHDDEMARDLEFTVQNIASTLSANRVPIAFRESQIRSIAKARDQQVPTLNEYRRYAGLPQPRTFEDINSSPLIQSKLKALYANPEEVELYPGIVAEQPRPRILCATAVAEKGRWTRSTVTHAVLCDTVALIRGDSFYTEDEWSPESVTNWGFHEPASDKNVNYGCVIHKLVLRAFPKHFAADSVFAHFPFVTPEGSRAILAELGADAYYSFEAAHGKWPEPTGPSHIITPGIPSFFRWPLGFSKQHGSTINTLKDVRYSRRTTSEPIEVDLVENIIDPYFVELFCSQVSLTLSGAKSGGLSTTPEVWQAMKSIHEPSSNLDPVNSLKVKRKAFLAVEQVRLGIIKARKAHMEKSWKVGALNKWQDSQDVDHSMCPTIKLAAHQLANAQQILIESVEYFLTDGNTHMVYLQQLSRQMTDDHPKCASKVASPVLNYLLEGYRLYLSTDGRSFWRKVQSSGHNFRNVSSAARNNSIYQNATVLALDRDLKSYEMVGVEEPLLELLGTRSILALFSELATFAGWDVVDKCRGVPRRTNISKHYWITGGMEESANVIDPMCQIEADWVVVGIVGGMEDDSWIVVRNEEEGVGDGDMMETWEPGLSNEVTVYPLRGGCELSNMPECLKVVWNPDSKR